MVSPKFRFASLSHDEVGCVAAFPEPKVSANSDGEETISLMNYCFPSDRQGKRQLASLFRASIFHLGAHVLSSRFEDYDEWRNGKDQRLAGFTISLIEDMKAVAYLSSSYPDKLVDIAFANTLALKSLCRLDNFINPATRCAAGLLIKVNMGLMKVKSEEEQVLIDHMVELLRRFKERAVLPAMDNSVKMKDDKLRTAEEIYRIIDASGPITEAPFLPYTEELGACSIFLPSYLVDSDITLDADFKSCLEFLGGSFPSSDETGQTWKKTAETEVAQVFEDWSHQKDKEATMLSKYENALLLTRFKSAEFPDRDYSEFHRIKSRSKSEAHRLIESLLVARDALDEDPRKLYGALDLQEVIQVVANKSPRMDVFMLDEIISKSYAWIILLDASRSMNSVKELALGLFQILADTANELLMDSASWALYAFNDRFMVIKDPKERYNERVKSRIGGIDFDGFTYIPDGLIMAGEGIKTRPENLRLITVISDGWPYGYPNINVALSETVKTLQGRNIVVLGIGVKSRQMELFFDHNYPVYSLRDMTKKFSSLYMEISRVAAES